MATDDRSTSPLDVLAGEWVLQAGFDGASAMGDAARVIFEWLAGHQFLIQRWSVPVPEAPDGIAIVGTDPEDDTRFLQHYFDSRGVARIYKMALDGRSWKLWRDEPDFSPLDFHQRYIGTISEDGHTIVGAWETSADGHEWEHDFDLSYRKVP